MPSLYQKRLRRSIFDEIVKFTEHDETPKEKSSKKGGNAPAAKLNDEERSAIAKCGHKRWAKKA